MFLPRYELLKMNKKKNTENQASNEANFILKIHNDKFKVPLKPTIIQTTPENLDSDVSILEKENVDPDFEPPVKKIKTSNSETTNFFEKITKSEKVSEVLDR